MVKKKVDNRVRVLIENAVCTHHRALFVMIGDRSKDQIVNLHYMLSKSTTKKPSILWCYKQDLGFSSHRKKRMKQLKKKIQSGLFDPNLDDPFELFVSSTRIRYCYYKETHAILGQTFSMCVLQDFEALTPNILCRTIETVEGGGIICILLKAMESLRQLYTLTMDVHSRLTSEGGGGLLSQIEPRFNERLILSLADCRGCLILDDELNVLPISRHAKSIVPLNPSLELPASVTSKKSSLTELNKKKQTPAFEYMGGQDSVELQELKQKFSEPTTQGPLNSLIRLAVTVDQAKVLISFVEAISEKTLNSTLSLCAGRGRGKSATLGLALAAAIAYSYSNIFVTAPSPEHVGTIFEFTQKGLISLGYKEHTDFELVEGELISSSSSSPAPSSSDNLQNSSLSSRHLVRINVFREQHRQAVQYITPSDIAFARQSEILVIDEAAAIPLPVVSKLFGPYLVFMSSTIHGYEGTGRSLSLKLLKNLKADIGNTKSNAKTGNHSSSDALIPSSASRSLKELSLDEPIRYSLNDPIEEWLNTLLCLNATLPAALTATVFPPPHACHLYQVNRDALFSYHKVSEQFLHKIITLFVSSHYKNSPNDLILLSDSPHQLIFVLLPPLSNDATDISDVFVAVQVALEGSINKEAIRAALAKGLRPSGDLIPWTLAQYFIDEDFGSLTGARIVRIAVHPNLQKMGYGTEALKQLEQFFKKQFVTLMQNNDESKNLLQPVGDSENNVNELLKKGGSDHDEDINTSCPSSNDDDDDDDQSKNGASPQSLEDDNSSEASRDSVQSSDEDIIECENENKTVADNYKKTLKTEVLRIRANCPSLLASCFQTSLPIDIDYLGTAFGITPELYRFHHRLEFQPVYLRQTPNDITGEHSIIMLKSLKQRHWIKPFVQDFRNRFLNLLGSCFQNVPLALALSLLTSVDQHHSSKNNEVNDDFNNINDDFTEKSTKTQNLFLPEVTHHTLNEFLTTHDILRLERYSQQLLDRSLIMDLLPILSWLIFTDRLKNVGLSMLQRAVILGFGSQRRSGEHIAREFQIPENQVLALFNKTMYKINLKIQSLLKDLIIEEEQLENRAKMPGGSVSLQLPNELPSKPFSEELEEGAIKNIDITFPAKKSASVQPKILQRYSINEDDKRTLDETLKGKIPLHGHISIKSTKRSLDTVEGTTNLGFSLKDKKAKKAKQNRHS